MTSCLNCGSPITGRFCAECGQRHLPPRPTLRELVGDAVSELVGWDGKAAATVRLLVTRPGELPRAFLDGHRARYISPVRLYLACSLLFFIVDAAAPLPEVEASIGFDIGVSAGVGASPVAPSAAEAAFVQAVNGGYGSLTVEQRALIDAEIARQPRWIQPFMRRLVRDYDAVQQRLGEILPRALFLLVPALALVLALFFRRRHLPEHLYVALHLQTVVFVAVTTAVAAQYSARPAVIVTAYLIAAVVVLGYVIAALKNVYGGLWGITAAKAAGIVVVYGGLYVVVSMAATLWVTRG